MAPRFLIIICDHTKRREDIAEKRSPASEVPRLDYRKEAGSVGAHATGGEAQSETENEAGGRGTREGIKFRLGIAPGRVKK